MEIDVIVIGGGPAGLSAAIYIARKNYHCMLITKNIGGQSILAGDVENYLGFTLINGADLVAKFRDHIERFSDTIQIQEGVIVNNLSGKLGNFKVTTDDGKEYFGKTVIIATGREAKMLGIPGERKFLGRGVAVCATCDAPLYRGKNVAVVGGGNSALDAAIALVKVAKSVTIVNLTEDLTGDEVLAGKLKAASNVIILNHQTVVEILGDEIVTGMKIKDSSNGHEQVIPVNGVFIEIGYEPATQFDQLTKKNDRGAIMVNESGATSVPGIWAAGDVNNLWGEQMIISAGEGAKTALAVAEFLSKMVD